MRSTDNENPVERKLRELFLTLWVYRRKILKILKRLSERSLFLYVFFSNFTKKLIYAISYQVQINSQTIYKSFNFIETISNCFSALPNFNVTRSPTFLSIKIFAIGEVNAIFPFATLASSTPTI